MRVRQEWYPFQSSAGCPLPDRVGDPSPSGCRHPNRRSAAVSDRAV